MYGFNFVAFKSSWLTFFLKDETYAKTNYVFNSFQGRFWAILRKEALSFLCPQLVLHYMEQVTSQTYKEKMF